MALTEKQIKNLKPGDPLIIHGTFAKMYSDGDVVVHVKTTDTFREGVVNDRKYIHPSCVSLPPEKPKHDLTRLFRVGDVVRFRKVNGNNARCRYNGVEINEGSLGRIVQEEGRNCFWVKFDVHHNWCLDAAYFELATPMEELEPYEVQEFKETIQVRERNTSITLASFDKEFHPNAKAAAESERDRLNEEWRKEQNHD